MYSDILLLLGTWSGKFLTFCLAFYLSFGLSSGVVSGTRFGSAVQRIRHAERCQARCICLERWVGARVRKFCKIQRLPLAGKITCCFVFFFAKASWVCRIPSGNAPKSHKPGIPVTGWMICNPATAAKNGQMELPILAIWLRRCWGGRMNWAL